MKVLASVTAACVLAAAGAVSAQDARIAYSDLDLSTVAGADAFDARVTAAARKMCRGARRPGSLQSDRDFCRSAVQSEAMRGLPTAARADYGSARRTIEL